MAAVDTPRSAARAKSGRMMSSGCTSAALELTPPTPSSVRSWRSASRAACVSTTGSSPSNTSSILLPMSPLPTWKRAPGILSSTSRIWPSMSARLALRASRCTRLSVSTARCTSAAAPGLKPSPLEPPPTEEYTLTTFGLRASCTRAVSATLRVCASVLPGGSSMVICVWPRSAGGTKPVGSSGTSISEPTKKPMAARMVTRRWRRHHCISRM